jgi:hypothetical protein
MSRVQWCLKRLGPVLAAVPWVSLAACGSTEPDAVVAISESDVTLTNIGATVQLVAIVIDRDGNVLPDTVDWSSLDTLVATVSSNGLVTAVADGATMVSAQTRGVASATTVTVADACQDVTVLMLAQPVQGDLAAEDCLFDDALSDLFSLALTDTTSVLFDLTSAEFDAALEIQDKLGNTVESDDDGGPGTDARINRSLPPGAYAIIATSSDGTGTGSYTLTAVDPCRQTAAVQPVDTVSGALSDTDCSLPSGNAGDLYVLTLTAPLSMQIDLKSTAIDPFLELRDATGALLASDDDGGAAFDAQITIALGAGTYTIVATAANPGAQGAYTLEVVGS